MPSTTSTRTPGLRRRLGLALLALVASTFVTLQASHAAFVDPDPDALVPDVTLDSDDTGGVPFMAAAGMMPFDTEQDCITVSYTGEEDVEIRMLGSVDSGELGNYLDLTIGRVDLDGDDCDEALEEEELYTGTLAGPRSFTSSHADWESGLAAGWGPPSSGTQTYRITVSLRDDNAAQGLHATASFLWQSAPAGEPPPRPHRRCETREGPGTAC